MPLDLTFAEQNRASLERINSLVTRLTDEELLTPVGEHWTVAVALAHMVFWDRRVLYVLDMTKRNNGEVYVPNLEIAVNDLSLPLWKAIPPREAARLSIEVAEECDRQLKAYDRGLLEKIYEVNKRWVVRALHRNEHLDEIDMALKK